MKFINQFLTSKKVKKGPDHMLTIRQAREESLRNYIARFNAKLHNVEHCELCFATSALKTSLATGPFLHSITKSQPRDHIELLARANKYILIIPDPPSEQGLGRFQMARKSKRGPSEKRQVEIL